MGACELFVTGMVRSGNFRNSDAPIVINDTEAEENPSFPFSEYIKKIRILFWSKCAHFIYLFIYNL